MTAPYEKVLVQARIAELAQPREANNVTRPFPILWVGSGDETRAPLGACGNQTHDHHTVFHSFYVATDSLSTIKMLVKPDPLPLRGGGGSGAETRCRQVHRSNRVFPTLHTCTYSMSQKK